MTAPTPIETINDLDEVKLLGYFETIRSAFTIKVALLAALHDDVVEARELFEALLLRSAESVIQYTGDALVVKAMRLHKPELLLNLQEDIIGSALLQSWAIFEQVIKDLPKPNYAADPVAYNADFHRAIFGFWKAEKDDLALFYYLRNAAMHYNGAYYAYHSIDRTYGGLHFKSVGHLGEKIIINLRTTYSVVNDLERYTMKAWTAVRSSKGR